MSRMLCAAALIALTSSPLGAEPPPGDRLPRPTDQSSNADVSPAGGEAIVVVGTAKARKVITGSRVPRRQIIQDGPIATGTGTAGLVPQSGMDPFAGRARTVRTQGCVSSVEAVGKPAASLMVRADEALAEGDSQLSAGLLRAIIFGESFNGEERLAAAQRLYAIGRQGQNTDLREEALVEMLATGLLPESDAIAAHRSLAAIAIARSEPDLAIARLTGLLRITAGRPQDWVNLAVLQRASDEAASRLSMQRAIELQRAAGLPVAPGWQSFVGG